jgi:ferritin
MPPQTAGGERQMPTKNRVRKTERRETAMLSKAIQDALNQQINAEISSAYLYLSMSAYCAAGNRPGSAHWMRVQWQEELSHAMKLFDYINDRGGRAALKAVAQPPAEFKSLLAVFQQVLEHEQEVTAKIHRLYELAVQENDYATQVMLQWFITEQIEEEKDASEIIAQLKMIGDQGAAVLMLDRHLGMREAGK